ncbi:MAG: glycosyltransferase family 39 protein [Leptolyngbyaceae cyanobacterium MAG.088]|nr:glycosyltransferase family 39 protein [Leptolyngbyaceae cyanobacterium MAG.088]
MLNKDTRKWLPLGLILIVGVILYFYKLGSESLWEDELYSIYDAGHLEFPAVFLSSTRPIYFTLLHFWMFLGDSEVFLRGFSIPFGLGSIIITYLIGDRLFNRSTGFIAALLLTLSPLFINHVQEVRFYSLSVFLNLLGTLLLIHALQKPRRKFIYSWALLRALAILTTPLNFLLLLPDVVIIGFSFRHQRSKLILFIQGLIIIGILWTPAALRLLTNDASAYLNDWVYTQTRPGFREILILIKRLVFDPPYNSKLSRPMIHVYRICTYLLLFLSLFSLWQKKHSENIFRMSMWAFLPSTSVFILAFVRESSGLWFARYLLLICPYFLILISVGFLRVWRFKSVVAIVVSLFYLVGVCGGLYYYYGTANHTDWRGAIQLIQGDEQQGDAVIFYAIGAEFALARLIPAMSYYYGGSLPFYFLSHEDSSKRPLMDKSQALTSSQASDKIKEISKDVFEADQENDVSEDLRLWIMCFKYCRNPKTVLGLEEAFSTNGFQLKQKGVYSDNMHVFLFGP